MDRLNDFMSVLTGHFNNKEQYERLKTENEKFPYARHVNTICNDKIRNLPEDFAGSPHLFLFTEEKEGVRLTSYETPEGYDQNSFTYDNMKEIDYTALKPSEKFVPALYVKKDGVWEGGSVSMFSPVLKFTLWERFSEEGLEVTETMEVNGKRTFGYDVPILYRKEDRR